MNNILILADLNSPLMLMRIQMLKDLPYNKYILHNANNIKLDDSILNNYRAFIVLQHPYIKSLYIRYLYSFFYTLYLLLKLQPQLIVVHWASRLYQNILLALWGKRVIVHTMGGDIDSSQDYYGKRKFFVDILLFCCRVITVKSLYMKSMIESQSSYINSSKIVCMSFGVEKRFFMQINKEQQKALQKKLFGRTFDCLFFSIRAFTPFYCQKEIIDSFLSCFDGQNHIGLLVSTLRKDKDYYESISCKEQDNIIFYNIPHKYMEQYILASDCLVSYSLSDGLSQSIMEGVAMKKWILANELQQHRILLKNGLNALCFNNEDGLRQGFINMLTLYKQDVHLDNAAMHMLDAQRQKEFYLQILAERFNV